MKHMLAMDEAESAAVAVDATNATVIYCTRLSCVHISIISPNHQIINGSSVDCWYLCSS
jgi:hypothetical protein